MIWFLILRYVGTVLIVLMLAGVTALQPALITAAMAMIVSGAVRLLNDPRESIQDRIERLERWHDRHTEVQLETGDEVAAVEAAERDGVQDEGVEPSRPTCLDQALLPGVTPPRFAAKETTSGEELGPCP